MCDDDIDTTEAPTRRDYMKYGGAVIGGGVLAGCAGQPDSGSTPETTSTDTQTATPEAATTDDESETSSDDESHTVEMFPVGEVEFKQVPETWTILDNSYADMAVALGKADGNRNPRPGAFRLWFDILGVELDTDYPYLWQDGGYSKEVFYELDCDVHFCDPNAIIGWDGNWDESDIGEIAENVGPFFACTNATLNYGWQTELNYFENAPTMLEAFEKVGEVFQEQERAQAFLDLHAEVQGEVESKMDGVEPVEVGLVNNGSDPSKGVFYAMNLSREGSQMKKYRDLGVENAFKDIDIGEGRAKEIDYEALLEIDPEYIVVNNRIPNDWGNGRWEPEMFRENVLRPMQNDSVGKQLTAVQEGNVVPGAFSRGGPIGNLFNTEITGMTLYPKQFGEFPFEQYPDIPEENQLFDRQRVADIINGDI
jgi:iron complex transport system substrate-binding protein